MTVVGSVKALEASADGSVCLLTGQAGKDHVVVAVSFDGYFDYVSSVLCDAEVHAIRSIHKSDFFLVGSVGKLVVLQLQKKSMLIEVTQIKDIQAGLIVCIELDNSTAYLLDNAGLKMTTLVFSKSFEKLQI